MSHYKQRNAVGLLSTLVVIAGFKYLFSRLTRPLKTGSSRVDDLIRNSRGQLDQMYLSAQTPTMQEMNGVMQGNVLAGLLLLNNQDVRNFLNGDWFIWRGKALETIDADEGRGINRFKVGPFRFLRYNFETRISPPMVGASDVFELNYDLAVNPWYVRLIRDDLRKIDDGLFLGAANVKLFGKHRFLVYFALESDGTKPTERIPERVRSGAA